MPKRILQINETSALLGGAEQHFQDLCTLLRAQGHQVRVFCPGDITKRPGRAEIRRQLDLLLRSLHPEIVHVHNLRTAHLWILDYIGGRGIPIVQTWHDHAALCLNQSLYNRHGYCERCRGGRYLQAGVQGCVNLPLSITTFWRRKVLGQDPYRHVRRVIVPSRYLLEKAREWGITKKIHHIYNFTRYPFLTVLPEPDQERIVFSGRLSKLKGLGVLLEAVRTMDCQLIVLGDGELRGEVARQIESSEPGKIIWPGFLTGSAYWEYLNHATVLALPTLCPETCGMVIVDAFSLGIPAVATDLGGARELIGERNERGMLVPPGDVSALRHALTTMLARSHSNRFQGEAGRRFVEENMVWDRYYPALLGCYREAADER